MVPRKDPGLKGQSSSLSHAACHKLGFDLDTRSLADDLHSEKRFTTSSEFTDISEHIYNKCWIKCWRSSIGRAAAL